MDEEAGHNNIELNRGGVTSQAGYCLFYITLENEVSEL